MKLHGILKAVQTQFFEIDLIAANNSVFRRVLQVLNLCYQTVLIFPLKGKKEVQ